MQYKWTEIEPAAEVKKGTHGTPISAATSPENHINPSDITQLILFPVSASAAHMAALKLSSATSKNNSMSSRGCPENTYPGGTPSCTA
ncbi:hypothetical protein U1Q18_045099 [Sarracenia purpurea var. burkii]